MRRLVALAFLAGCGWSVETLPEANAPSFAPPARVELVEDAPPGAQRLGRIKLEPHLFGWLGACRERLTEEARLMGGDLVADLVDRKAECEGDVFRAAR